MKGQLETEPTKRIPVRVSTWKRLRAFRGARSTYDEAVNELLRSVPVERLGPRTLRQVRRRLATRRGRGIDWHKVRKELGD